MVRALEKKKNQTGQQQQKIFEAEGLDTSSSSESDKSIEILEKKSSKRKNTNTHAKMNMQSIQVNA